VKEAMIALPRRTVLGAALLSGLVGLALAPMAVAQAGDPAAAQIESFHASLLEVMKQGPALGANGRYRRLTPVVERAFDLPLMTQFAVGPSWATTSESDRRALIAAFTRLTAASYAHNLTRYSGEKFTTDPAVQTRGADKIVQAHLIPAHGSPTSIAYRMRQDGGIWKIVDVYYGAVSQLTTRRADFAAPLASGGATGLVSHLDTLVAKLLA
jgi:phospholipid transport system substrate-binding protein